MSHAHATEAPTNDPFHNELHPGEDTATGIPNKKVAMWAFLASDCMFFGTLISTHLIYRKLHPTVVDPKEIFSIELTSASTFILLMSSLLMALAVSAMHKKNVVSARWCLAGVIFFGSLFVGAQCYEFHHFVHAKELTLTSSIFGSTFYVLTGTHGVHVTLGIVWLIGWFIKTFSKSFKPEHALDIEVAGLYWHFVDIVWIIIFPFVYLIEYI
ncbi:MAG: heme-copper oxidase subunit III [Verrucomicrobiota bacterium]|nr:heme-copper oxidase subunit III [Verrucomicrobiota bacterium]